MRRKTEYDASKLTQIATNKTVISVYVDAFPIEQVKLRFAEFEGEKNSITLYIAFEDTLRLVQDIKSGKLFKDILAQDFPLQISFGGSVKDDIVESRQMSVGMSGDKIYLNAQIGPGKVGSTGAIFPDGKPTQKISVGMSINDFKKLFLYIEAGINAFLPQLITSLVDESKKNRETYSN